MLLQQPMRLAPCLPCNYAHKHASPALLRPTLALPAQSAEVPTTKEILPSFLACVCVCVHPACRTGRPSGARGERTPAGGPPPPGCARCRSPTPTGPPPAPGPDGGAARRLQEQDAWIGLVARATCPSPRASGRTVEIGGRSPRDESQQQAGTNQARLPVHGGAATPQVGGRVDWGLGFRVAPAASVHLWLSLATSSAQQPQLARAAATACVVRQRRKATGLQPLGWVSGTK